MIGLTILLGIASPGFVLGYFRSWKVGVTLVSLSLITAGYYQWFDDATGLAAEEGGAKFAPVFFLMLAGALLVALAVGWGARSIIEMMTSARKFGTEK